jgi:nucleotide-binding universal stress UspA family protein
MTTILVPVDGSSLSEAALPIADRIARERGGEVVLMSVTELPETTDQAGVARRDAEKSLERPARGIGSATRLRVEQTGDPVRGILHAAAEEHADLMVMASSDPSGVRSLVDGSIAEEVEKSAAIPVQIVEPG